MAGARKIQRRMETREHLEIDTVRVPSGLPLPPARLSGQECGHRVCVCVCAHSLDARLGRRFIINDLYEHKGH